MVVGEFLGPGPDAGRKEQLAAGRRPQAVRERPELRWSATLKTRISSTVSPKNSIRSGCSSVGGNTSSSPPRTASSPRLVTISTRA